MDTPICDFVQEYADSNTVRLHMPGHKGKNFLGMEKLDITEIDNADILYNADGIIRRSEENASSLFGTAITLYSAEGSSLCIRAMLYLAMINGKANGKPPLIAAGRNAHKVFMTAAAMLDLDILWLFPENQDNMISCNIDAELLDKTLSQTNEKPAAVYITSPDYLGNISDIPSLARVCRKYGVLLLVDNAHGAYLNFLPQSLHPMDMGADICCDSAHKTLPVLTGGAYLHISRNAPKALCDQAENAMSIFASTSPSYLVLQSLDAANQYLSQDYTKRLVKFAEKVSDLKERLIQTGYSLIGNEPMKLTIAPKSYGYTGNELAKILSGKGIVCEFADKDYIVMMFTPETGASDIERLEKVLCQIKKKFKITEEPPILTKPLKVKSARDALFSPHRQLDVHKCCGMVLASANVSCPPAIPIVVCGERIDESVIRCFDYYGIKTCFVAIE